MLLLTAPGRSCTVTGRRAATSRSSPTSLRPISPRPRRPSTLPKCDSTPFAVFAGGFDVLQRLERVLRRLHRIAVRLLQLGEDLFPVHVYRARRLDAEAHLVPADFENRHDDLVPDHDALIRTSCEHEHRILPPWRPLQRARARAYALERPRAWVPCGSRIHVAWRIKGCAMSHTLASRELA